MMYSTTVTRPAGLGGGRSTSCEMRPYMYLRRVMRRVVLRPDTDHTVRLRVNCEHRGHGRAFTGDIVASDRVVCLVESGRNYHVSVR